MKNQSITLPVLEAKQSTFKAWCEKENVLFSWVLEESTVTNHQVLLLGHSSLAFSVLVCAAFVSAISTLVCLVWFIVSLRLCVKGGLK